MVLNSYSDEPNDFKDLMTNILWQEIKLLIKLEKIKENPCGHYF